MRLVFGVNKVCAAIPGAVVFGHTHFRQEELLIEPRFIVPTSKLKEFQKLLENIGQNLTQNNEKEFSSTFETEFGKISSEVSKSFYTQ